MSDQRCCVCGAEENHALNEKDKFTVELRPYGPGGAPICFECAMHPDRKAETERNFGVQLDAALAMGEGVAVIAADLPVSPASRRLREALEVDE